LLAKEINKTFLLQESPLGIAQAIMVARGWLGDDEFILYLGDNLFERDIDFGVVKGSNCIYLKLVDNVSRFGVAELNQGKIVSIVEKPRYKESGLAITGVYKLTSDVHDILPSLEYSDRGELEITDLLRKLDQLTYDFIDGVWLDTGKEEDLLAANNLVLSTTKGCYETDTTIEVGCSITYKLADNVTLLGPCSVSKTAYLQDCNIGPGASIGNISTIVEATIKNSIVGSRVKVDGSNIQDSLIGSRCTVNGFNGKIILGDDCEVLG
jgi:glucose-1-phosphate thymidylyltransferase